MFGLVKGRTGGEAGVDQGLLALVGRGRLLELAFGRPDARLGGLDIGLLGARIEAGQDLVGRDVIADVHAALDDPAAEPKRQVILDLRLYGPVRVTREVDHPGGDDINAGKPACDCPSLPLQPDRSPPDNRAAPVAAAANDAPFRICLLYTSDAADE